MAARDTVHVGEEAWVRTVLLVELGRGNARAVIGVRLGASVGSITEDEGNGCSVFVIRKLSCIPCPFKSLWVLAFARATACSAVRRPLPR